MKNIFKKWRVLTLLIFLIFAITAVFSLSPGNWFNEGVAIRSVEFNSTALAAGIENPSPDTAPLEREVIKSINGQKISNVEDYNNYIAGFSTDRLYSIKTNKDTYSVRSSGKSLGIIVEDIPKTNLRKGLDLAGGTRVLLEPQEKVSSEELDTILDSLQQRLNVYGLSDVVTTTASDLQGNDFILVEIAGATQEEVSDLLSRQGKFEAKIANQTVFFAGGNDITYVCRSADCSGINPQYGCSSFGEGYACSFFFSITLSPEAAQRQADVTSELPIISGSDGSYLSEDLVLYLDDVEVDSLRIASSLKGRPTTNIQITGSGSGITEAQAVDDALQNMKELQTIIVTGSLPVKLDIVKMDTISASLGKEFLQNILLVAVVAIASVLSIVFIRYRTWKVVIPMIATIIAEIILILGFAALMKWQLDLAAIAGVIIVAGTGVDHLIVITDETLKGERSNTIKQRIKSAMFIVFGAYLTTISGMAPLLWAGAGLIKGFALTTIAGISFGVLIARPAFAAIIEELFD